MELISITSRASCISISDIDCHLPSATPALLISKSIFPSIELDNSSIAAGVSYIHFVNAKILVADVRKSTHFTSVSGKYSGS